MHDALEIERRGVPAAAIITAPFAESVRAIAGAHGWLGYEFAVIPHPIADNDDDTLREKAESIMVQLATLLTRGPSASPRDPGRSGS